MARLLLLTGKEALPKYVHDRVFYEDVLYNGNEVRILHIKQVSIIYSIDNEMITLIAVWNNYQDPEKLQKIIEER